MGSPAYLRGVYYSNIASGCNNLATILTLRSCERGNSGCPIELSEVGERRPLGDPFQWRWRSIPQDTLALTRRRELQDIGTERVTGRLTWGKVLGGGVLSGAWLGLFIGLVLGFFSPNPWGALVTGLVAGVFFGLITSAVPYAMARGTRDFSSTMQLVAGRYDVLCDPQNAEKARDLLARLAI